MKSLLKKSASLALLIVVIGSASAHHSTGALFDLEKEVILEGTISRYEWKNPHLYFYVERTDDAGKTEEWRVEAGPLSIMRRLGWARDSLTVGDEVVVVANPSRRVGNPSAFLKTIETAAGALPSFQGEDTFETLSSDSNRSGSVAESLAGTWVTLASPEALRPLNEPSLLNLTPAGKSSVDSFDELTMHPGLDCIPFTAPIMMLTPDFKSIEIAEDVIWIRGEFDNAKRAVYMDSKESTGVNPSVLGHSRGRWERETLHIETDQFTEHRSGNAFSLQSSNQKTLREELVLNADGTSITYRFELRDPIYLIEPFVGEATWVYRPDVDYLSLECDIENSRLFLDE